MRDLLPPIHETGAAPRSRLVRIARLVCAGAEAMAAQACPGVALKTRVSQGAWATYHRGPCSQHPRAHLLNFGTGCIKRVLASWNPVWPSETSGREMVRFGWDHAYGPMTGAVRLACLTAHEVAHLVTHVEVRRPVRPHGPEFLARLKELHRRGRVARAIAGLEAAAEELGLREVLPMPTRCGPATTPWAFEPGMRVSFLGPRGAFRAGTVKRVNRTTISVQADEDPPCRWWRVPPRLARPL